MKRLVIFLSCVLSVQAQGIITDWRGASASVVASTTCGAAQCTEITTTETHGLATGYYVGITGGSGNWVRINTQQEAIYVKQAWDQAATSVIVSDTTRMEPTAGASWALFATSEGASYGCPSNGNETLTMSSITDSRTAVFTRGTPAHNHCPEDQIIGPTNRNDGFGTVAKSWQITVIDSTHYTIPLDSHLLGAFTGTLVITHGTSVGGQIFVPYTGDGDPNALNIQTNHTAQWVMDSCNTAVPLRCANAYTDPMNQFGYGTWATLSTQSGCSSPCMVVSGGTGTIVFSTGWTTSGGSSNYRALAANAMCWLWGFNEPGGEPWGTINRMWPIASVTGTGATGTTITFAGMNAAGIADGNYTLQTGKTTKNFYFPFSGEEYIYFTSGATDTNYPTEWPTTLVQSNGDPTSSSWNRWSDWWMPGANFSAQMVYSSFVRNGAAAGVGFKPYSTLVLDFFSGQWLFHRVSTWPDHLESASAPWVPAGADAIWNGSIGYQAQEIQPGLLHYEQGTRVYYMNLTSLGSNIPAQTGYLGPFTYSNISNEPEEWTSDLAATYDGSAYHVYVRAPATQRNGAAVQYNFYYNTSSSHLAGNISGATSFATGVAAVTSYAGVNLSTSQAQATSTQSLLSTLYLDVQPILNVSGVSGLGQSPVILSFLLDPNLTTSSTITASGIGGNAAANVTGATVSAVYPRQILYRMIPHYPSPTVAGPLTSITVQNGGSYPTCTASTCTCTANLAVNTSTLNIWPGSTLGVIGVPAGGPGTNPPGPGNNQIQTFFNVIAVNSTSFDFSCPNPVHSGAAYTPGTYNTDGASTNPMVIVIQPAVAVPPNGTPAAWDGAQNGIATSPQAFAEINFTPPSSSSPTVCQITGPASPLPDGIAGTPYSETITTTGCASPVFSIVPGIPPGLSIGSSSGTISGTPTVPNPYSFIVEVTDANGNPTSAYGLTIDANPGAPGGTQILGTVNIQGQVTLK